MCGSPPGPRAFAEVYETARCRPLRGADPARSHVTRHPQAPGSEDDSRHSRNLDGVHPPPARGLLCSCVNLLREVSVFSRVDIFQTPDQLVVESDLPGVAREDVEIWVSHDCLRIHFSRRPTHATADGTYLKQERVPGSYQRDLKLPHAVDPDSLTAELQDGILRVRMRLDPEGRALRRFDLGEMAELGEMARCH